jgi:predicted Zn-dependent peptidase
MIGYHTVNDRHPDAKALELLGSVLAGGRTSMLYKEVVEGKKLARGLNLLNGIYGTEYGSLFTLIAIPNRGIGTDSLETAVYEVIEKAKNGQISEEALDRARTKARANLIRSLDSNSGLAEAFAQAESKTGQWQTVFTDLEELEKVTVNDLQRVANKYLIKTNRTVGVTVNKSTAEATNASK